MKLEAQHSHWLIGIAEPPHEQVVCERIRDGGVEIYLPIEHKQQRAGRGRLREIQFPILRPYFFVPARITDAQYSWVRHTRGVRGFLEIEGKPAVMRDRELNRVRSEEAYREEKRRRRAIERGEAEHFIVGEAVDIMVGFAHARGTVHSVWGSRAKVALAGITLFGRDVVEVDLTHLAPAPD